MAAPAMIVTLTLSVTVSTYFVAENNNYKKAYLTILKTSQLPIIFSDVTLLGQY